MLNGARLLQSPFLTTYSDQWAVLASPCTVLSCFTSFHSDSGDVIRTFLRLPLGHPLQVGALGEIFSPESIPIHRTIFHTTFCVGELLHGLESGAWTPSDRSLEILRGHRAILKELRHRLEVDR